MESLSLQGSRGTISYRRIREGSRKILYFHGFPGSSAQINLFSSAAKELGLDVVCFDRTGYNKTDFKPLANSKSPNATELLNTNLQITTELLQHLAWTEYEIVTVSGGTPYGVHVASELFLQVNELRIICGLGDLRHQQIRPLFKLRTKLSLSLVPFVPSQLLDRLIRPGAESISPKRNRLFELFYPTSESDRAAIHEHDLSKYLSTNLKEALAQSAQGPKWDAVVFNSNWSQSLKPLPKSHLWHGDHDKVISYKVSQVMAAQVYRTSITVMGGEGHLSLPVKKMKDILSLQI